MNQLWFLVLSRNRSGPVGVCTPPRATGLRQTAHSEPGGAEFDGGGGGGVATDTALLRPTSDPAPEPEPELAGAEPVSTDMPPLSTGFGRADIGLFGRGAPAGGGGGTAPAPPAIDGRKDVRPVFVVTATL